MKRCFPCAHEVTVTLSSQQGQDLVRHLWQHLCGSLQDGCLNVIRALLAPESSGMLVSRKKKRQFLDITQLSNENLPKKDLGFQKYASYCSMKIHQVKYYIGDSTCLQSPDSLHTGKTPKETAATQPTGTYRGTRAKPQRLKLKLPNYTINSHPTATNNRERYYKTK